MPQDFSGQNLRGRSFKGQELSGANFSYADIRGGDFTNANLKSTNFKGAKAGLQSHWVIGLLIVSWLLSVLSGFFSIIIGIAVAHIFDTKHENFLASIVFLIILAVFSMVSFHKGLAVGLGAGAVVLTGALAVALAGAVSVVLPVVLVGGVAVVLTGGVAVVLAVSGALAIKGALAGALAVVVAVVLAVSGALAGAFRSEDLVVVVAISGAFIVAVAVAVTFTLFCAYIGQRSLAGDEKHALIRPLIIAFAAIGGTSFRGANLTDADFTSATLESTDFRGATLTRTYWYKAKMLDRVRPGMTYLRNAQL